MTTPLPYGHTPRPPRNFGPPRNTGPGSYDPVSNFSPFRPQDGFPRVPQGRRPTSRGRSNVPQTTGPGSFNQTTGPGSFNPVDRLRQLQGRGQQAADQARAGFGQRDTRFGTTAADEARRRMGLNGTSQQGVGHREQVAINDAAWRTLLGGAIFQDMGNQQGIMNEQFGRGEQAIGQFGQQLQQGAEAIRSQDQRMRQNLGGIAQQVQQQGKEGYDEFTRFRDKQLGAVGADIDQANKFAAEARAQYEKTIGEYKDRSAQQAGDLRIGLERQVQNQMRSIEMGRNPDGSMMTPAEKAAMTQNMQQAVSEQVSQGVNQIYTNLNDTMAQMGQNLSQLTMAQSQTAMAGGQLRGQVGTAFGAQTIDAQRSRDAMTQLSASLNTTMEQLSAASELQAVNLLTNGYKDMYGMIMGNRRGATSMFAALTGYIAAMTTPGITFVPQPEFGGR